MKTTGKIALGILAGLGVAASAVVLAHGYGPMAQDMAGGPEAHLSALKTELKLTAKQEPAWQAFEKTVREQVASHGPGPGGHDRRHRPDAGSHRVHGAAARQHEGGHQGARRPVRGAHARTEGGCRPLNERAARLSGMTGGGVAEEIFQTLPQ